MNKILKYFIYLFISLMFFNTPVYAKRARNNNSQTKLSSPVKADGSRYKVFVQDVKVVGMDTAYSSLYADKIANALTNLNLYEVVTMKDLGDLLTYEKQKELLACDQLSCAAEIGGAMGADYMLNATVIRQDSVYSFSLTFSNVAKLSREKGVDESIISTNSYYMDELIKLEIHKLFKEYLTAEEQLKIEQKIEELKVKAKSLDEQIAETKRQRALEEERERQRQANLAEERRQAEEAARKAAEERKKAGEEAAAAKARAETNNIGNTMIDPRDRKTYRTIKIGNKIWMAENLAYDGVKYLWPNGKYNNVKKYGFLYNWENAKKACPRGWRLPTMGDFKQLLTETGAEITHQVSEHQLGQRALILVGSALCPRAATIILIVTNFSALTVTTSSVASASSGR